MLSVCLGENCNLYELNYFFLNNNNKIERGKKNVKKSKNLAGGRNERNWRS